MIAVVAMLGEARRRVGTIGIEIVSPKRRLTSAEADSAGGSPLRLEVAS